MNFDLCSKMKILEGDLANANPENKRKRQDVAMQVMLWVNLSQALSF